MNIEIAALDALIDNPESTKQISDSLEYFGFHIDDSSTKKLIDFLLEKEYIKIYYVESDSTCYKDIWFEITASGKKLWETYAKNNLQKHTGDG